MPDLQPRARSPQPEANSQVSSPAPYSSGNHRVCSSGNCSTCVHGENSVCNNSQEFGNFCDCNDICLRTQSQCLCPPVILRFGPHCADVSFVSKAWGDVRCWEYDPTVPPAWETLLPFSTKETFSTSSHLIDQSLIVPAHTCLGTPSDIGLPTSISLMTFGHACASQGQKPASLSLAFNAFITHHLCNVTVISALPCYIHWAYGMKHLFNLLEASTTPAGIPVQHCTSAGISHSVTARYTDPRYSSRSCKIKPHFAPPSSSSSLSAEKAHLSFCLRAT